MSTRADSKSAPPSLTEARLPSVRIEQLLASCESVRLQLRNEIALTRSRDPTLYEDQNEFIVNMMLALRHIEDAQARLVRASHEC